MKLNPYAFILIGVFIAIVAISDRQIKQKNIYEKIINYADGFVYNLECKRKM